MAGFALIISGVMPVASHASDDESRWVLPDVPVTTSDRRLGTAENTPLIVADPTDEDFLALAHRFDWPDFRCGLQLSGDGGRGWIPAQPVPELPEGAEKCYAGEAAFDGDGALYYLYVGLAGAGNRPVGAFLTKSQDRGRTWAPPRQVLGPDEFGVRLAVDQEQGRIHLVWLHSGAEPALGGFSAPTAVLSAHSDDGGESFSEPVQVSSPGRERLLAPALALGPDAEVHVGFYDLGDDERDFRGLEGPVWEGTWSLVASSSDDGGRSFSESVVDDGIVPHERIMLVFTMAPPTLVAGEERRCAAWTDARNGDPDALMRCADGRGWGELRRINDDPVGNGISQYQPRLDLAPNGRLDAVFYDRRLDPGNRTSDVFFTSTEDGGQIFTPNIRLTRESSNTQLGPQYAPVSAEGLVEFGSRLGLLATEDRSVAAWTDTRNGAMGSWAQDIFATNVVHPEDDGPGMAPVALVVAGGAAVLGLVVVRRRHRGVAT